MSQAGPDYPYREPSPEESDEDEGIFLSLQYAPTGVSSGVSFGHSSMLSLSEILTSDDLRVDSPIDTSMGIRTGSRGWVGGSPPLVEPADSDFVDPDDWDLRLFNISEDHRSLVKNFSFWGSS